MPNAYDANFYLVSALELQSPSNCPSVQVAVVVPGQVVVSEQLGAVPAHWPMEFDDAWLLAHSLGVGEQPEYEVWVPQAAEYVLHVHDSCWKSHRAS